MRPYKLFLLILCISTQCLPTFSSTEKKNEFISFYKTNLPIIKLNNYKTKNFFEDIREPFSRKYHTKLERGKKNNITFRSYIDFIDFGCTLGTKVISRLEDYSVNSPIHISRIALYSSFSTTFGMLLDCNLFLGLTTNLNFFLKQNVSYYDDYEHQLFIEEFKTYKYPSFSLLLNMRYGNICYIGLSVGPSLDRSWVSETLINRGIKPNYRIGLNAMLELGLSLERFVTSFTFWNNFRHIDIIYNDFGILNNYSPKSIFYSYTLGLKLGIILGKI